ncbi:MAG: VOC family protein [Caulobacterales bacterium]|nr:VOC family protein [Caulobacterales bacterium]
MSDTHGRFIWYELMTPHPAAAKTFYRQVVGWQAQDMPVGDSPPYTVFDVGGAGVGGMMPLGEEHKAAGVPPNWTAYVCVDDVGASAKQVDQLGGSVMRPPQDIPGIGRFAIVADPAGAVIAIMTPVPPEQPRPQLPPGAEGGPAWHELYGADPARGFDFYGALFGWTKAEAHDMGPMGIYQLFNTPDGQVGGMMRKPDHIPQPVWVYYFQVGDIEAAADRVKAAGGQLRMGPMEVPSGAWVLQGVDPQGAAFALLGAKAA